LAMRRMADAAVGRLVVALACVTVVHGADLVSGTHTFGNLSFYVTVPSVTPANVLVISGATCHAKGDCTNRGEATWHVLNGSMPELAQKFIIAVSDDREVYYNDYDEVAAAGGAVNALRSTEAAVTLKWSHSQKVKYISSDFLELIVKYDNVKPNGFRYMGTSKGGILMHSLLIENDDKRITHVACVGAQLSPLLYRDGKFRVGGDNNTYEEEKSTLVKRKMLQIMGSKDDKMPVKGGRADVPGPDDQEPYDVLSWEESALAYAKAYGYTGGRAEAEMVTVAQYKTHVGAHGEDWQNKTALKASYLDDLVTAYVATDASHSVETILDHASNVIADFLMSHGPSDMGYEGRSSSSKMSAHGGRPLVAA